MASKRKFQVHQSPLRLFFDSNVFCLSHAMAAMAVVFFLASVAGMFPSASAQSISSLGFQIPVPIAAGITTLAPNGIAIDTSGDVFIADFSANERVIEIPAGCTNTSCQTVFASGFNTPTGLAFDGTGDLFVAEWGSGDIVKIPAGCSSSSCWTFLLSGSLSNPAGLAIDASGNLFIGDFGNNRVVKVPSGCSLFSCSTTVGIGASDPYGVAVDQSGNLYIADHGGSQVVEVPVGCSVSLCQQVIPTGSGSSPAGIALDGSGDIFVADFANSVVLMVPKGCLSDSCATTVGTGLNQPLGLAVSSAGDIYIADWGNNRILKARQNSFNVGSILVGQTSTPVAAYFTFGGNVTLNATTPYQVLTQGATGLDFADAGGGNCAAASYVAGNTCTVNVTLSPQSPGPVAGAVTLADSGSNRIVTAYISGVGSGPQISFFTNPAPSSLLGAGLGSPSGLALDRQGNLFVADTAHNAVDEFLKSGGYSKSALGGSFSSPGGVAVDGAGNVIIADTGHAQVQESLAPAYTALNSLGSGFVSPAGVTVDGAGDIFVADAGSSHAVKEIVAPAYTTVKTLNSSFSSPSAVAADAGGNLFVADSSTNTVSEITAASGYTAVLPLSSGLEQPASLALDASGNIYVADTGHNAVDELFAASSYAKATLSSSFTGPSAVALDVMGNIYVTSTGVAQVTELNLSAAPTLNFGSHTTGNTSSSMTVTVSNIGNADLTFPVAAVFDATTQSNGSFTLDASTTCSTSPLSLGTDCAEAIDFSPANAQSYTGTYTLTDNNLNTPSPYATQAINLTGTGVTIAFVTTSPLSSGTVGVLFTPQTLQVSGGSGTYTFAITGGALPAGLGLSSAGTISGTPTAGGTFTGIQITATDTSTNATGTETYSVTIAPATITLATASLPDATYNTSYSQAIPAASGGTAPYTYILSSGSMPPGLTVAPSTGVISGIPTQGGSYPNFVIQATDSSTGTGPYSTTQTYSLTVDLANQATLTVTGVPVTPQAYQATFTVGSAGGSGTGALTFAASGACTNTAGGALITMSSGTGTCSVTAAKAADTNFNSATSAAAIVGATMADQATLSVNVSSPAAYNSQQTLTATGGSGTGALTYSVGSSTACSVSGDTLTVTSGTGTCSVMVTKAADANYNSATSAAAPVTVQATIAIVTTLPTASPITYGQTLSESTLTGGSATPSAGSFQWVTPSTVPLAGTQSESVIFVPTDTADYSSSAPSAISVTVNPASFIVTVSSDDSGTASNCTPQTTPGHGTDASCSLRDALMETAATGGGNITFDSTAFGAAKTITLSNGTLNIPSATTIAGTTAGSGASLANLLTVDGNSASTVFTIGSGVTGASIANLTIQHGNDAGIQNAGALTLTGASIISNTATGSGGGVNNSGALTLASSTVSGNSATGSGGGISNSGTLTLSDDTISGNSANVSGGGISNTATLVATDTTLSGNTAVTASGGGGIDNTGSGTAALANDVVSGNSSNSAADDFDGVAYTDNGGNIVGVSSGVTVNAGAIDLAPLGSYGGPTQTLIPLPGSTAICAGLPAEIPSGLTTDQRGLPNTNANYPGYATCVDAGAVQTNYALSFTTQPTGVSVATNFAAAVTLNENGNPFQPGVTIPLTLTGSGTLTGGSASTSAGMASYTLQVDTAGSSDQLTANLALNGGLAPAVAISAASNTFNVGMTTPTVDLTLSSNSITYGTLETMTANVPVAATGSVSFYNNGTTLLGTGTVSGGIATFASSTLTAGSYSITAAYSGDSNYNPNTSSASPLTISPANQATLTVTGMPVTVQAYEAAFTVGSAGGSGTGAITFAASGACSVDANSGLVTMTSGTGTCSVTAAKAADTNYNSATSAAATVAAALANQATLTVTGVPVTPQAYQATFTVGSAGGSGTGALTFAASGACTNIDGGALITMSSGTGTCSVTATKAADTNYNSTTSVASTVAATLANQATLTVNASSPAAYNTQQTLTTTGGSGMGAITYSVGASTACTVSGATLSITAGTGTCSVTATKAADANYSGSTSTAATVTVQLATQTITFTPASPVTYGISPITLSATGGASGNPVTFSLVSGPATLSDSTLTVTGIGTINVTATQAGNTNYSAATPVSKSIVVNQAALTVEANNAMRVYGVANPTFTGNVTGAVDGDGFTESFLTTATITSNAGPYSIVPTAMGPDLADYSVSVQDGMLTITQAGTTISLNAASGSITPGQSVMLTAQVASATTGTPTGSVNFYDGATLIGTAPLSAGTAMFTTSALSPGITHQLTAVYSGDINFTTSSTSQSTSIVVAALDFTLSPATPGTESVNAGGAAGYQVVVAPLYGTYPGTVTFAVTGLPSGAVATISPSSIPANGGQQSVSVNIQTAAAAAAVQPSPLSGRARAPLALALLLLPLIGVQRLRRHGKGLSRALCALLLLLGMATMGLSGCIARHTSTTATSYMLTITATSGNVQHTAGFTVVVK